MNIQDLSPIASLSSPTPQPLEKEFSDSFRQIKENLPSQSYFEGRFQLIQYLESLITKDNCRLVGLRLDSLIDIANKLQKNESDFTKSALVVPNGCYVITKQIGSGSYSDVFATTFLAFKPHNWANKKDVSPEKPIENLIIKVAKKSGDSFEKEHHLIQNVNHKEYIDYFIEFGTTKRGISWAINRRFEGTLSDAKYSLYDDPIHSMISFTFNILTSLGELHKKQIRHGDIKGLNILVRKETAILTDFGFCEKPDNKIKMVLGTEAYLDPRVFAHEGLEKILINGKRCRGRINTLESDLYSVGKTILWDIVCRFLIQRAKNCSEITKKIRLLSPQIYQSIKEGEKFSDEELIAISKKFPYHCYFYQRKNCKFEKIYTTTTRKESCEIITGIIQDSRYKFDELEKWKIRNLSRIALALQSENLSERIISIDEAKGHVRTIAHKTAVTAEVAFPNLDSSFVTDLHDISKVEMMDETIEIEEKIKEEIEEHTPSPQPASQQSRREEKKEHLGKPQKKKLKVNERLAKPRGKPHWIPVLRRPPDHYSPEC